MITSSEGAPMTAGPRRIPHGTSSGYVSHKCRCDACREAEIARQRAWRQRLRDGKVRHCPDHPRCVPVRVRGTVYPSISAAAAALRITPGSISGQLDRKGHADAAGLGSHAPRRKVPRPNARPCVIHGRRFASIAEAARALGVGYAHLHRQLKAGMTPRYRDYLLGRMMRAGMGAER